MAILTPSALISNIRGSIGGGNFYTSKHGIVLRRKANRKRSYSKKQAESKEYWSRAIAYAKTVSGTDLDGIVTEFANSMHFSKNGHSYTLSPFRYLVTLNYFRFRFSLAGALPSGQPRGRLDIPPWSILTYAVHKDFDINLGIVLPANVYAIGSCSNGLGGYTPGKPSRFPNHGGCPPGSDDKIDFKPVLSVGINTVYVYFRLIDVTGTWTPRIWGKHSWNYTG